VIFREEDIISVTERELARAIGPIQEKTPYVHFNHTNYYQGEMGGDLLRYFILFESLFERGLLPSVKLRTNEVEEGLSAGGKRRVNIDPGYLSLEHVVLATTKGYAHRIYLKDGIYADLTLVYEAGTYKPLRWTYPDYGSEGSTALFGGWRDEYRRALRRGSGRSRTLSP